jgi:hypothetical protein
MFDDSPGGWSQSAVRLPDRQQAHHRGMRIRLINSSVTVTVPAINQAQRSPGAKLQHEVDLRLWRPALLGRDPIDGCWARRACGKRFGLRTVFVDHDERPCPASSERHLKCDIRRD